MVGEAIDRHCEREPKAWREAIYGLPRPEGLAMTMRGVIHECIALQSEAVALGFLAPLLTQLATDGKPIVWVSQVHKTYTPGLVHFGLSADKLLFVQVANNQDALWALENTLKTAPAAAIIGENLQVNLTSARRLQLAAKKSLNTLFLLYTQSKPPVCNFAMSRWEISPLPSSTVPGLFCQYGVGNLRFHLELTRLRGGVAPQSWDVEWNEEKMGFDLVSPSARDRQFGQTVPESETVYARYGTG